MNRSDYRLVRSLLTLQRQRATGTLRVEAEGILTVTRFREGHPARVEGGLPADSLGRLLVQRGRISESTLAKIEEQRMVTQGRLRFGEVATRLGVLEADVIAMALRDQIRDKVGRCLHWERSQHAFVAEDHDAEALEGAPLDIEPLLLAGIARHYSAERVQDVLGPIWQEKVELRGQTRHVAARFAFDPDDQRMFEQLLSATSVGQLLTGPARKNPRFGHLLVALALSDQLKMPELELPEESGPFIIDELPREPREPRKDGQRDSGPIPVVNFELLRRSQPPIPPASNLPGKDKLLADSAFLQGKELLRAGEYGAAADAFREAANLRPGALEYTLFAAWSAYLSAGREKKWRDMLVELCDKALAQDRHLAFAHHVKGRLALEKQDQTTAKQCLERALELDPNDDEAKRLLDRMRS